MLQKIINSTFSKPLSVLLAIVFLAVSFDLTAENATLKAGTNIPLETVSPIDTEFISSGQMVDLRVAADIKVDSKVVIKAGSLAKGQIVNFKKNGAIGSPGKVEVQVKSVQAVDGQEVYLVGGNVQKEGESKLVLSIALSLLICPLFLLIKGKNAEVPAGTQLYSSVATESVIAVKE